MKYEVEGQRYEFPDEYTHDQAWELINQHRRQVAQPAQGSQGVTQAPVAATSASFPNLAAKTSIDPDTLQSSPEWLGASRELYKMVKGVEPDHMSSRDLAEFGLDQMGWFNYNLPSMAVDAARIKSASPEQKKAFLYLMDNYDQLEMSWSGAGRFIKGVVFDPTTYVGLSTLGLATAGAQAGKVVSKAGLKSMLRAGIYTGIEGAVQGGVQEGIQQTARINADGRTQYDAGKIAASTAVGAAAGAVLGGGADALRIGLTSRAVPKGGTIADEANPVALPHRVDESGAPQNVAPASDITPRIVEAPQRVMESPPAIDRAIVPKTSEPGSAVTPESASDILKAIREVAAQSGLRIVPDTLEAVERSSAEATQLLTRLTPKQVTDAVEQLRREATTGEERQLLENALKTATDALEGQAARVHSELMLTGNPVVQRAKEMELASIEKVRDTIKEADRAYSSMTGRMLGDRQGSFNTGERRGLSEDTILAEQGLTRSTAEPEQLQWAKEEYYSRYHQWTERVSSHREVVRLTDEIAEAVGNEDIGKASALAAERQTITDTLAQQEMTKAGVIKQSLNTGLRGLNEYIISTVFTPATLVVNTIPSLAKTAYRPFLDYVVKGPTDSAAFRQMIHTYSAIGSSMNTAFRAARLAFDLEKGLLSQEPTRYLEFNPVIPGQTGRLLRIFPRLLNATDEFFGQLNYRGFVAGEAANAATKEGAALGLKGEALSKHVAQKVDEASQRMFSDTLDTPSLIDMLRQSGILKGYSGEKLTAWMKLQLDTNADLFRKAEDQAGRSFAEDMLFKRDFSGDTKVSALAKGYERFVNDNPWMRLAGQLFFRTPVRVFEEGFRLTAGVNLLSGLVGGSFLADLKGVNGQAKQAKALGEAMLSYGIASWAMLMYSQGKLTGGGPDDWKQRRGREAAGDWEPYSIRTGESVISFRNLDPFSTPLKIVANALDRYQNLMFLKAQGEYTGKQEKEVLAWLSVGSLSLVQAVRDANLTEGIDQLLKMGEAAYDPENKESALTKLMGQKAQLLVPNVISKVQQQHSPYMTDPASVEQFIRAKVNPADPLTPKQYNSLGQVRQVNHPEGALTGLRIHEQGKVVTKEQAVLKELSDIEITTGRHFIPPYRVDFPGLQGLDLRALKAKGGTTTMYDRWMQIYSSLPVTDALHSALVTNKDVGSYGTRSVDGTKAKVASAIIQSHRRAALVMLMQQETGLKEDYIHALLDKGKAVSGQRDSLSLPYR